MDHENVVVIVGPSGIGKTSNAKLLNERFGFARSTTITTSSPREDNDPDYYRYVDETTFQNLIQQGRFLEWDQYGKNYYGTLLDDLENQQGPSCPGIVICSSPTGYPQIKAKTAHTIGIALLPKPGYRSWLRQKLIGRATNSSAEIDARMKILDKFIADIEKLDITRVDIGYQPETWETAFADITALIRKAGVNI